MSRRRVTRLIDKDINRFFVSGERNIVILDSFKSLYIGADMQTGEEFTFYNTGMCTSIKCGWLERDMDKIRKAKDDKVGGATHKDNVDAISWFEDDRCSIEVVECGCGYHMGVDATYIEQVGGIIIDCPSCGFEMMYGYEDDKDE